MTKLVEFPSFRYFSAQGRYKKPVFTSEIDVSYALQGRVYKGKTKTCSR